MNSSITLSAAKQGPIRRGHPWIFPKAIQNISNAPKTGQLITIYTADGEPFGTGIYNEHSLYRVRVLALNHESCDTSSIEAIVSHRLKQAISLRQALGLPNENTTAYRLFNSEGDGLSGLTIDRFNQVCVISSSAYWLEAHKAIVLDQLQTILPNNELLWLPQQNALRQDGWQATVESRQSRSEIVQENGVKFRVDFAHTQKTGLFLDQRENHARLAALTKGKRVLDLYTYSGGFALHAAKAGATKISAVDSSAAAIASGKLNAELNQLDTIEWNQGDARDFLTEAKHYDVIILDPPKLAPSQQHAQRAKNYYRFLHRELFKSMQAGSLLLTCNCSSALNTSEFAELAYGQARSVNKTARMLGIYGPASCHPTLSAFPEGNYLTAVLLGLV